METSSRNKINNNRNKTNNNRNKTRKRTKKRETKNKSQSKTKNKSKNKKSKYYSKLRFDSKQECLTSDHHLYTDPSKPTYKAIFPFALNIQDAEKMIIKKLLPDNLTGQNKNKHLPDGDLHRSLRPELIALIDEKINSPVYELLSIYSFINTFNYMFHKIKAGIYVQIRKGKIQEFIPFENLNYINNWSQRLEFTKEDGNLEGYLKNKKEHHPDTNPKMYFKNADFWGATNCIIQNQRGNEINDSIWSQYYDMINQTCRRHQIPDIEFIINKKSFPVLKNDYTEPYEHIYDSESYPLTNFAYTSYYPILSRVNQNDFADLPIPDSDQWMIITQKFFRNNCSDLFYYGDDSQIEIPKWENKKATAFWRGSSAGCGTTIKDNLRLKIAYIHKQWDKNPTYNHHNKIDGIPFLDAQITRFSHRDRKLKGSKYLKYQKIKDFPFDNVGNVYFREHSHYKYIVYIDSFTNANQLLFFFAVGSLVLRVESKYRFWFDDLIKPNKHYLPVKADFSNLAHQIKWAKENDNLAKKIASNGHKFSVKYLNEDYVCQYMAHIFKEIAHRRVNAGNIEKRFLKYTLKLPEIKHLHYTPPRNQSGNINNTKNTSHTSKARNNVKTYIIVPYRDNPIQNFGSVKREFIKRMTRDLEKFKAEGLVSPNNFQIIIVEQSDDMRKFNRGQLINLGVVIAEKEKAEIIITHDISITPDYNLWKYYFQSATEHPIHLAFDWNKYQNKEYFYGATLFTLKLYKKFGGYPNSIWGWGKVDTLVYNRYYLEHKNNGDNKKNNKKPLVLMPTEGQMNTIEKKNPLESSSLIQDPLSRKLKLLSDWEGKYLIDNYNTAKRKFPKNKKIETQKSKSKTNSSSKISYTQRRIEFLEKEVINDWIQRYKFNLGFF